MPRYLVRQPSGLLAEFSTIVDDFVEYDMTEAEAVQSCLLQGMTQEQAHDKVRRGLEDRAFDDLALPFAAAEHIQQQKLGRWHDALDTILTIHGWKRCLERMRQLGEGDGEQAIQPASPPAAAIRVLTFGEGELCQDRSFPSKGEATAFMDGFLDGANAYGAGSPIAICVSELGQLEEMAKAGDRVAARAVRAARAILGPDTHATPQPDTSASLPPSATSDGPK